MSKEATLYRMVMDKHICPYGLKSKDLLESKGYKVEDHHLTTREETDAFKEEHGVKTTPQTFIDGERIGGYDDLKVFFRKDLPDTNKKSYTPVIAVFATTFLMAISGSIAIYDIIDPETILRLFIAFSMCVLAVLKLRDLESFSLQFLNYDLLAQKKVKYAYVYPFAEAFAGIAMISGLMMWLAAPVALFIGSVGAYSVYKAVYVDKRDLKCACVGGNSNVPLGAISLTENLMMVVVAIWMMAGYGF